MRLWQRLFLAFAVLSGLALLGFALWQQHSFRRSFLGYLNEVTLQRLAPAAQRLAQAYVEQRSWDFLREDPARFAELIEPGPGRSDPRAPGAPDRPPPPPDERGPAPDGRSPRFPPHGPPDLMPRLLLLDAAGDRVAGNPHVPVEADAIPIVLDGQRIGTLRVAPLPQVSGATDLAFARAQAYSALLAGGAVLVGALFLALALARWLLAPVRGLTEGTRALADGDYARRLTTTRSDELGALSRDFNHLAAALEQHRQARRQWGADISHELRTPLSILRGEIQALQDGVRPLSAQALESLQAECGRLGSLIEDLYQLSLADAGALEYRFESLDLAECVRDAVELQRRACADAGLALEMDVPVVAPVRADARRVAQLLDNLLANARRYTDAPGRIRVALETSAGRACIIVDDTAPGVPADALPRLFERLYRVEQSRARDAGGAGLGLAICRAIVDAHGGRIAAQTSALGGVRIVAELPLEGP
jgi:two-component system, OmpR family, sensor histidine kinase BaeS